MYSEIGLAQLVREVIYDSPSSEFIDLSLQTHNDKLRFGEQDNYYLNVDGSFVDNRGEAFSEAEKKTSHNILSRQAFVELLKIRFQEEIFSAMDREFLTKRTQNMYEKELKSYAGQQQTLALANALCSKAQKRRFFCNQKAEDCDSKFREDGYYNEPRSLFGWGGKGASEFQQLRAYTTFVGELFPKIRQWGNEIHKQNSAEGYFVGKVLLGEYDFKNRGFWLNTDAFYNTDFLLRWHNFQPSNSAERTLASPKGCQILLKLPRDKAEKLAEKHQFLFVVFGVVASFEGIENYKANQLKTLFSLSSLKIEVFKDDSLTQKLSVIDINSMITKTRY
ncbi:hypothetical protein [Allomuricauda sp. SCSIO 65647]|uniref:hypothetical protein n=1 Tax=Allomuricauda sp. SCSIO 65647 TaxID=2908843 RepID=UPI001F37D602|nr:hypothetical protein [Muricauda sp. SCSIO 65647]UJH68556.1 hypothetical protein L0P89_04930 [Muricauda sp. SCSIO 65647]